MKKILSFGDIIWDIYGNDARIGGAALNFAAHCAQCGSSVAMYSSVGRDELGERALTTLKEFGVGVDYVRKNELPTGQCRVSLSPEGIPTFRVLVNVAYDAIEFDEKDHKALQKEKFDAIYYGSLIQRDPRSRKTLRNMMEKLSFSEKICDVNLRKDCYDADSIGFCLKTASVLKVSQEEEPILRSFGCYTVIEETEESIVRAIASACPDLRYLLFTLGAEGSLVYDVKNDRCIRCPGKKVKAVSTVGAGDSFLAAWVHFYLSGETVEEATERATSLSAFVVAHEQAVPSYAWINGEPVENE